MYFLSISSRLYLCREIWLYDGDSDMLKFLPKLFEAGSIHEGNGLSHELQKCNSRSL